MLQKNYFSFDNFKLKCILIKKIICEISIIINAIFVQGNLRNILKKTIITPINKSYFRTLI